MADGVSAVPVSTRHAEEVLTAEALDFAAAVHRRFAAARHDRLAQRVARRAEIAATGHLEFDPAAAELRERDWTVSRAPAELRDRRVEISTAPAGAAMIAALNADARVWLADFTRLSPSWPALIAGQVNLRDALLGTVSFTHPDGSVDRVRLDATLPAVIVRPRDLATVERNLLVDGEPIAAAFADFAFYAFHNAANLLAGGSASYFSLTVDSRLEARLWAELFTATEHELDLPAGALRADIVVGSVPAAAELEEILHELRAYATGVSLDLDAYAVSHIAGQPDAVLPPDPGNLFELVATQVVRAAHRRGTHAIGPVATDPSGYRQLADAGFDGARVVSPDEVTNCSLAFSAVLEERPHQISRLRYDIHPDAQALLVAGVPNSVTAEQVRDRLDALTRFLAAWLAGDEVLVDPSTIERARAQVRQWAQAEVALADDDTTLSADRLRSLLDEVAFDHAQYALARMLVEEQCLRAGQAGSLTAAAYDLID